MAQLATGTFIGNVGGEVSHSVSDAAKPYASFRVAVTHRKRTASGDWVDDNTTWLTVKCWGSLANNAALSLKKGDTVVVTGRVQLVEWQGRERTNHTLEVLADAIGHDLNRYVSKIDRRSGGADAAAPPPAEAEWTTSPLGGDLPGELADDGPAGADAPSDDADAEDAGSTLVGAGRADTPF